MLTYGEAHIERSRSMRMIKGVWVSDELKEHKKKMSRSECLVYYSAKLREVWLKLLSEFYAKEQSEKIIKNACINSVVYRGYCFKLKRGK